MDDTIYREAAVKHLKHRLYETAMNNLDLAGVFSEIAENRIETWIEELPSAQPEPLTLRVNHELTKEEYDKLMHDIKDAPIVLLPSAQPEIVRCRDCKHWKTDHPTANGYHCCHRIHNVFPMREDDFCSRAEKREK